MELPENEKVERKNPNPESDGNIFSNYMKINNTSIEKLSFDCFDISEILNFYQEYEDSITTLPLKPQTAKNVDELFTTVDSEWRDGNSLRYGVVKVQRESQYVGDLNIQSIDWDNREATVEFFVPQSKEIIPDILVSTLTVLIEDLGIRLVRLRISEEDSDTVNDLIKEVGGFYEGVRRMLDEHNETIVKHTWSITREEFLNNQSPEEGMISYEEDG